MSQTGRRVPRKQKFAVLKQTNDVEFILEVNGINDEKSSRVIEQLQSASSASKTGNQGAQNDKNDNVHMQSAFSGDINGVKDKEDLDPSINNRLIELKSNEDELFSTKVPLTVTSDRTNEDSISIIDTSILPNPSEKSPDAKLSVKTHMPTPKKLRISSEIKELKKRQYNNEVEYSSSDSSDDESVVSSDSEDLTDEEADLDPDDYERKTLLFSKRQRKKLHERFHAMLTDFFCAAFTMLVKRKNLLPSSEFGIVTKFGRQLPVFVEERSLEYVTEVSNKIVFYMQKNALKGAVFHVLIENEKSIPVTQQRIVFKPNGYFSSKDNHVDYSDATQVLKLIHHIESQFSTLLFELSKFDLKPLECPWFSHWSISIGLKKEFVKMYKQAGYDHLGPFCGDPSEDYFPWRKRPRYSQAVKLGYLLPKKNGVFAPGVISDALKTSKKDKMETTLELLKRLQNSSNKSIASESKSLLMKEVELPEWVYFSSSDEDEKKTLDKAKSKKPTGPPMDPITSELILNGLMVLIFKVDYPSQFPIDQELIEASRKHEKIAKAEVQSIKNMEGMKSSPEKVEIRTEKEYQSQILKSNEVEAQNEQKTLESTDDISNSEPQNSKQANANK